MQGNIKGSLLVCYYISNALWCTASIIGMLHEHASWSCSALASKQSMTNMIPS